MPPRVRPNQEAFSAAYAPIPEQLPPEPSLTAASGQLTKLNDFLEANCSLTLGTEEQGRLYCANPDGTFTSMKGKDLTSPGGRTELMQLAQGSRLFAVPAGEVTPVQLRMERSSAGWSLSLADNLEKAPERPGFFARLLHRWFPQNETFRSWVEPAESIYQDYRKRKAGLESIRSERTALGASDNSAAGLSDEAAAEKTGHSALARKGKQDIGDMLWKEDFSEQCAASEWEVRKNEVCGKCVDDVYGAEPVFVSGLAARKSPVYTKEQFDQLTPYSLNLAENAETHTVRNGIAELQKKDFAALAMFSALTDSSAGKDRSDGSFFRPELRTTVFSTMFTADLAKSGHGESVPRENLGSFFGNPVQPGRERAKSAVEAYRKGDLVPIAKIIAAGLDAYDRIYARDPQGSTQTASMADQAGRLVRLMESAPALRREVEKQVAVQKAAAADALRKTETEHSEFRAANGDVLQDFETAFRSDPGKLRDFYRDHPGGKDQPDGVTVLKNDAQLHGIEMLCRQQQDFDLDAAVSRVKANRQLCETVRDKDKAVLQFKTGILHKQPLSAEQKKQCLRAVLREQVLQREMALTVASDYNAANAKTQAEAPSVYVLQAMAPELLRNVTLTDEQKNTFITQSMKVGNTTAMQFSNATKTVPYLCSRFAEPEAGMRELDRFIDDNVSPEKMDEICQKPDLELLGILTGKSLLRDLKFADVSEPKQKEPQRELSAVKTEEKERTLD